MEFGGVPSWAPQPGSVVTLPRLQVVDFLRDSGFSMPILEDKEFGQGSMIKSHAQSSFTPVVKSFKITNFGVVNLQFPDNFHKVQFWNCDRNRRVPQSPISNVKTRVCLKIVYPIVPNGFADHYPYEKWLFHWEYTQHFQANPQDTDTWSKKVAAENEVCYVYLRAGTSVTWVESWCSWQLTSNLDIPGLVNVYITMERSTIFNG